MFEAIGDILLAFFKNIALWAVLFLAGALLVMLLIAGLVKLRQRLKEGSGDGGLPVAFLDRDGTISKDYPDDQWPGRVTPELYPDTLEALRAIRQKGYAIIIVTNQYLIEEGQLAQADYDAFTASLLDTLEENGIDVLDVFYCPHARNHPCGCRKPADGMIRQAQQKYPAIDMARSFVAGDSDSDCLLAENAALPFFRVDYKSGEAEKHLSYIAQHCI